MIASCPLLFFDLGARVLGTNDETRFPLLARDILDHGTWLLPRLNGVPHLNKPPLHAWLVGMVSWPAGSVNQTNAGLASLLAALVVIVTTGWIGQRLCGARVGTLAGGIVLTTYGVFSLARAPLPDMTLCAAMTGAMAAYGVYALDGRRTALVIFYVLVGVAFWAKGPAGLLPIAVAIVDTVTTRGWRGLGRLASSPGLLALLVLLAPWWVAVVAVDRQRFVGSVVMSDFLGWYLPTAWHGSTIAEPFKQTLTILLPWSLAIPPALWFAVRAPAASESRAVRFLLAWAGTMFVLLAVSAQQRMRYYLPLAPPVALLVAAWYSRLRIRDHLRVFAPVWLAAALGLSLWQVYENRRDNAATDFATILHEVRRAPGSVYAVDVPELVFTFYLEAPVTRLARLSSFEGRRGYLIVADRAVGASPVAAVCRRATGRVNHRAISLVTAGRCPSESRMRTVF
jgi:4-amino-4-deoxy-L-arabinose transferase-like glycosyltransferase